MDRRRGPAWRDKAARRFCCGWSLVLPVPGAGRRRFKRASRLDDARGRAKLGVGGAAGRRCRCRGGRGGRRPLSRRRRRRLRRRVGAAAPLAALGGRAGDGPDGLGVRAHAVARDVAKDRGGRSVRVVRREHLEPHDGLGTGGAAARFAGDYRRAALEPRRVLYSSLCSSVPPQS